MAAAATRWMRVLENSNRNRVSNELARRCQGLDYGGMGERKMTAVLVPILVGEAEPEVVFTVRSRDLRQHRGQVSFPGGRAEPGDGSPTVTALRETEEELGIPRSAVNVWGSLPALPDRRNKLITAVIATVEGVGVSDMRPQCSEVESIFTLSLSHLVQQHQAKNYTRFRTTPIKFPLYSGGPRTIWGITAFILKYTLPVLIPNELLEEQNNVLR